MLKFLTDAVSFLICFRIPAMNIPWVCSDITSIIVLTCRATSRIMDIMATVRQMRVELFLYLLHSFPVDILRGYSMLNYNVVLLIIINDWVMVLRPFSKRGMVTVKWGWIPIEASQSIASRTDLFTALDGNLAAIGIPSDIMEVITTNFYCELRPSTIADGQLECPDASEWCNEP